MADDDSYNFSYLLIILVIYLSLTYWVFMPEEYGKLLITHTVVPDDSVAKSNRNIKQTLLTNISVN